MENPSTKRKGWFRPRNIILVIALAIVATVSWALLEVWRLQNAEPVISVNYRERFRQKSVQLAGITIEEGEQSWTLMCEAISLSGKIEEERRRDPASLDFLPRFIGDSGRVDFSFVRSGDVLSPDIELERQALRMLREQGFFDALARFETMPPGLAPVDNMDLMNMPLMPESSNARSAAKTLAASMRIEAAAGNGDEAVRNFAQMLALARTISLQPTLIFGVISVAIETLAFTELRSLLMEHEFTAGQCEAMLTAMDRHRIAGLEHALEAERVSFHDMIQRHFSDDGKGDGYAVSQAAETPGGGARAPSPVRALDSLAARFYLPSRRQVVAVYDDFMDRLLAEAALRPIERWKRGFDTSSFVSRLSHRYQLVAVVIPAIGKAIEVWEVSDQQREATRLMIHLARYRTKHGVYPATLEDLVPEFLTSVPHDLRYDTPFGYRLLENDDHRRPFLLYSYGVNREDDGGVVRSDDRPLSKRERVTGGLDVILNPPRERMNE
jgi:hypothetical protein